MDCPFTATASDRRGWESRVGGMQAGRQAGGCMPLTPSEINAHTYSKERNLWRQMATAVAAGMQRHCHKEQKQLRQKFQSITVTITMSAQGIQ